MYFEERIRTPSRAVGIAVYGRREIIKMALAVYMDGKCLSLREAEWIQEG